MYDAVPGVNLLIHNLAPFRDRWAVMEKNSFDLR